MSRQFLVDGYNVMYRLPRRGPAAGKTLEDGRTGLIHFIREHRPQGRGVNGVTVIFDGRDDVFSPCAELDIRVIFTQGTSADDCIRDMVEDAVDPRRIICVTDDRELAIACRHRGAEIWSVAQFLENGRGAAATCDTANVEEKVISPAVAGRINRELSGLWLERKKR